MNIDTALLRTLWYENAEGDVWEPDYKGDMPPEPPEGFIYMHSRFPGTLYEKMFRAIVKEEVTACDHPAKFVVPTYGWVDGIEGRECKKCHGTQVHNVGEPWPEEWDSGGASLMAEGTNTWSEDIVTAMVMSGDYKLKQAIMIAALSCERCLNVLYRRYHDRGFEVGDTGYEEGSDEWKRCNTVCDWCKEDGKD